MKKLIVTIESLGEWLIDLTLAMAAIWAIAYAAGILTRLFSFYV